MHANFDHSSRHSTMIFTVNSMTMLMDNVERASARTDICMCPFFYGMDIHTRVYTLACMRQEAEAGVRSRGFKLTGLKSIVITPVWVLTRAQTRVCTWNIRESWASLRVSSILKKKNARSEILNISAVRCTYEAVLLKMWYRNTEHICQIYRIWRN